jgi:hypothetical protein
MVRPNPSAAPETHTPQGESSRHSTPTDRAKQLTKPFAGDAALDDWAARMQRDAEAFQKNRPQDTLGNLFVMNSR